MRMTWFSLPAVLVGVAACSQTAEQRSAANETNQTTPSPPVAPAPTAANEMADVTLPDDRTPLEEPKGPIDPKSAEAAGQVVQHYGALIEQGRWAESWTLWSDPAAAKEFDRNWRDDSEVHMEIGEPGDTEGAAGSIYTNVPAIFYGRTRANQSFRRAADITLRRVNDVPGSTAAQRRWHIERIDWKKA